MFYSQTYLTQSWLNRPHVEQTFPHHLQHSFRNFRFWSYFKPIFILFTAFLTLSLAPFPKWFLKRKFYRWSCGQQNPSWCRLSICNRRLFLKRVFFLPLSVLYHTCLQQMFSLCVLNLSQTSFSGNFFLCVRIPFLFASFKVLEFELPDFPFTNQY